MTGKRGPVRAPWDAYRNTGLGCLLAAAVVLFMAAGWLLDRRLGWFPALTLVGAILGAVLGTFSVYRRLEASRQDEVRERLREAEERRDRPRGDDAAG
jgi:F0F1-type ATP synthase assembly protein I